MQHRAGFISADSLYMFRASGAHHQEYLKTGTAATGTCVMVAGRSSHHHIGIVRRQRFNISFTNSQKTFQGQSRLYRFRKIRCSENYKTYIGTTCRQHLQSCDANLDYVDYTVTTVILRWQ